MKPAHWLTAACAALLAAGIVRAGYEDFICTDLTLEPDWGYTNRTLFCFRDGTPVPYGLFIQPLCCEEYEDAIAPPEPTITTNIIDELGFYRYGYYTRPLIMYMYLGWEIVTGIDNTGQGWPVTNGTAICNVQVSEDTWWGWMRVFSSTFITNSAYYGDCEARVLDEEGDDGSYMNFIWPVEYYYVSNINPAYALLHFDEEPRKVSPTMIVGSINTVAGGDNNLLANEHVTIHVSQDNGQTWQPFQSLTISGPGNFTGTLASATLSTPLVKIVGPINGYPQSSASSVIPEPAAVTGMLAAILVRLRRK